ncbi:TPA: TolC family protein, partial [Salmonella enterica subsp. diarizonae serovar 61:l,v:z35]
IMSLYANASQNADDYKNYIEKMYQSSDLIKIKELELEAEGLNGEQVELYFLPKVTAESKLRTDTTKGSIVENKLELNSLLFDSSITDRFKEKNNKINAAKYALVKEKEVLRQSIIENLIGIEYYKKLFATANDLEVNANLLYKQIESRYSAGVAKESDVEQAKLLIQKIETESHNITKEIDLLKSNIELSTGESFPERGVMLPEKVFQAIDTFKPDENGLHHNLDYEILKEQMLAAKNNIAQQNSLFKVSALTEQRYKDNAKNDNDSYFGIQVNVNLFDYNKKNAAETSFKNYQILKTKMDFKYKELQNTMKSLILISNSNEKELKGLENQSITTKSIIRNQKKEYSISQASYYEMLNTKFDSFSLDKKITEIKINDAINKIAMMQLTGNILSL